MASNMRFRILLIFIHIYLFIIPLGWRRAHGQTQVTIQSCPFSCKNGNCVQATDFRDGQNDCGDYSDEDCLPWDYTCPNSGVCVTAQLFITGTYDCTSGSDFCSALDQNNCSSFATCINTGNYYKCICPLNTTRDISPDLKFPGRICQDLSSNSTDNSSVFLGASGLNSNGTIVAGNESDFINKDCRGFRWGKNRRLCVPRSYGIIVILLITAILAILLIGCCLIYWILRRYRERRVMDIEQPLSSESPQNIRSELVRPVLPVVVPNVVHRDHGRRLTDRAHDLESSTSSEDTYNREKRRRRSRESTSSSHNPNHRKFSGEEVHALPMVVANTNPNSGIRGSNKVAPMNESPASSISDLDGKKRVMANLISRKRGTQYNAEADAEPVIESIVHEQPIQPVILRVNSPPLPETNIVSKEGPSIDNKAVVVGDFSKHETMGRHTVVEPSQPIIRKFEIIEDNITESIDRIADERKGIGTNPFTLPVGQNELEAKRLNTYRAQGISNGEPFMEPNTTTTQKTWTKY